MAASQLWARCGGAGTGGNAPLVTSTDCSIRDKGRRANTVSAGRAGYTRGREGRWRPGRRQRRAYRRGCRINPTYRESVVFRTQTPPADARLRPELWR
jgi:hypothetical protein